MVLKYVNNERAFAQEVTNIGNWGRRRVKNGCLVEAQAVPDMTVKVNSGTVLFGTLAVTVMATNLTIAASNPSNDRIDLIVVDSLGTASVIDGTTFMSPDATLVKPENYDPDLYVLLARVYVDDGVLTITNSVIKDLRLSEEGPAGAVAGGLARYIQAFAASSIITVTHNLNDSKPQVQVYDSTDEMIIPDEVDIVDVNTVTVTLSSANTGTVVVHGGQFTSTGITSRTETLVTGVTTFDFAHDLGVEPDVLCVDTTTSPDEEVEPQNVQFLDANTIRLTFSPAFTGKIVAIGGTTQTTDITKLPLLGGTMSGTINSQDVIPKTNLTYDLGDPTHYWDDAYIDSLNAVVGNITTINATTVNGTFVGDGSSVTSVDAITLNGLSNDTFNYIEFEILHPDESTGPRPGLVGFSPTADFAKTEVQFGYFNFRVPRDMDITQDMFLELSFTMDSSAVGNVKVDLDSSALIDTGDLTAAAESTTTETISAPSTLGILKVHNSTVLKIPNSIISASDKLIQCKLKRDATAGADTHTGKLQLVNYRLKYTRATI